MTRRSLLSVSGEGKVGHVRAAGFIIQHEVHHPVCVIVRVDSGLQSGHQIWLTDRETITVGSTAWADFTVQDRGMAAVHFQLESAAGGCRVVALDPKSPLVVNGHSVQDSPIDHQDIIVAGKTRFRVIVETPREVKRRDDHDPWQYPTPEFRDDGIRETTSNATRETVRPRNCNPAVAEPEAPRKTRSCDSAHPAPFLAVLELESPWNHRRFWLRDHQVLSIGCSHWADVTLPNEFGMDGVHFSVATESNRCYLRDLGSSSGVRVNGRQVEATTLQDGDEILAGQTWIRVRLEGPP